MVDSQIFSRIIKISPNRNLGKVSTELFCGNRRKSFILFFLNYQVDPETQTLQPCRGGVQQGAILSCTVPAEAGKSPAMVVGGSEVGTKLSLSALQHAFDSLVGIRNAVGTLETFFFFFRQLKATAFVLRRLHVTNQHNQTQRN